MRTADAKRRLGTAAAAHGAHVEDDSAGSAVCLQVCAPEGKVWAENGAHHIVVATHRGPQEWLDRAVEEALEQIQYGLTDAPDEDSEP